MKRKRNESKRIWLVLMIFFIVVALVSAGLLIRRNIIRNKAAGMYDEMQALANDTSSTENTESETEIEPEKTDVLAEREIEIPEKNLDWDALHAENADIYSWIYVPDANTAAVVDYPILQHPTDDYYYLDNNIDGTQGYPGAIYTEQSCTAKDWTDPVTVVYGHNWDKGIMFNSLHAFDNEEYFRGSDHFVYIYTEDYTYVYEIFSAGEYHNGHLLYLIDYTNEYVFDDFVKRLVNVKEGRTGFAKEEVEVNSSDKLLVLSTCAADHNASYRYLVVGKLLNPRE